MLDMNMLYNIGEEAIDKFDAEGTAKIFEFMGWSWWSGVPTADDIKSNLCVLMDSAAEAALSDYQDDSTENIDVCCSSGRLKVSFVSSDISVVRCIVEFKAIESQATTYKAD